MTEEIVGYEMMIRGEPSNVALHNDVAVIYTEMGQPDKAVRHLEVVVRAAAGFGGGALQPRNGAVRDGEDERRRRRSISRRSSCGPTMRLRTTTSGMRCSRWGEPTMRPSSIFMRRCASIHRMPARTTTSA